MYCMYCMYCPRALPVLECTCTLQRWHLWRRPYDLFVGRRQYAAVDAGLLAWEFELKDERGGTQIVNARVPLSEMFGYATDLRSRTQGRATYSMHFDRYEQAPANVSEEVIARVQGTK